MTEKNKMKIYLKSRGIKRGIGGKFQSDKFDLNKEEIIRQYREGIPVKIIAENEDRSMFTIYKYLVKWGVREKKERMVREEYKKEPEIIVPFKERISPEILLRMKENTLTNQKLIKYYKREEDWIPKKRILEGV
jgi:hypothetical protein